MNRSILFQQRKTTTTSTPTTAPVPRAIDDTRVHPISLVVSSIHLVCMCVCAHIVSYLIFASRFRCFSSVAPLLLLVTMLCLTKRSFGLRNYFTASRELLIRQLSHISWAPIGLSSVGWKDKSGNVEVRKEEKAKINGNNLNRLIYLHPPPLLISIRIG